MKLQPLDLAILLAWMVAMVLFGIRMGRRQKDAADFMVGGRDLPWWAVLFSIVATETSTVTFLSIPGFAYGHDLRWLQLPLGYIAGRLIVVGLLLPRYFRGELFTAYEVLSQRFGGATRQVASGLFIITRTLADGLRLFLSAIVLQEVAGIPLDLAIVALGLATIAYTFLGGMRAVIWTDCIQFLIYIAGAAIAFGLLLGHIDGGLVGLWDSATAAGKLHVFDLRFDLTNPYLLWTGLIGGAVLSIATHGVDQMMVQRYLCARSRRQAAVALGLSGVVVWLQFAFFLLIGVALYIYYQHGDPIPRFDSADRVFATFIVDEMPPGVLGIVLGALFSAAMSTLSSSLNSSATALLNDIHLPLLRPAAGEGEKLRTLRVFTVLFGAAQIAVGIGGQALGGSVVNHVLAIAGFTTGIILGVFLLGILTRHLGQGPALTGMVGGLAAMSWIHFGTDLAWPWYALVGSSSVLALGLLTALVLPGRQPPGI